MPEDKAYVHGIFCSELGREMRETKRLSEGETEDVRSLKSDVRRWDSVDRRRREGETRGRSDGESLSPCVSKSLRLFDSPRSTVHGPQFDISTRSWKTGDRKPETGERGRR